ncbi:MAG: hypothetical protein GWN58_43205, partial [Anaerolineae bacterium]|nr:hypothetical protein [Anaerolineae bacterium]
MISGNLDHGVGIGNSGTDGNAVKGNYIGTDAWGTAALPNGQAGVIIFSGAKNNSVGGIAAGGERNVIAYNNEDGVQVHAQHGDTTGNTIRGNSIHS